MKKKKLIALFLAACMTLSLAACGSSDSGSSDSSSSDASSDTTEASDVDYSNLTYGVSNESTLLDPVEATDAAAGLLFRNVYENLWYFDNEGNIVYQLAESYEYDETETILTIHLREGVTFHNGDAFTADDVLFTLERNVDSETHAADVAMIDMDATTIVDDYTIELHLTGVSASLVNNIGQMYWYILDREYAEENPDDYVTTVANGTGAYQLDSWNLGESFELSAYDGYWGDAASYETVSIKFISDDSTRMMELEAGNLDIAVLGTVYDVEDVEAGTYDGFSLVQISDGSVQCLELNMVTDEWAELYGDINLRMALFHSIDLETMLDSIAGSTVTAATSVIPSTNWAYEYQGIYEYDVDYAKECLAAAGYDEGELTISIQYQQDGYVGDIFEAIQAYWAEIGVNLELEGVENSVWGPGMISGEISIGIMGAQSSLDPTDVFTPRKVDNGALLCTWPTDELIELDTAAEATTDTDERQEYYSEIQQIMYENYYAYPLYEDTSNWAVSDSISGFAECCDALSYPNLAMLD